MVGPSNLDVSFVMSQLVLLVDFWAMIKADKTGGANRDALRIGLLAVVGVSLKENTKEGEAPEKEAAEEGEEAGESPADWGFFEEDQFFFRPKEQKKAFAYFKDLYINRV